MASIIVFCEETTSLKFSESVRVSVQAHGCRDGTQRYGKTNDDDKDDDDDDDDEEEGWEEWIDTDYTQVECLCLFCLDKFSSPEAVFIHCREKHQFDIYKIHTEFCLDCFSYIKMINYIRKVVRKNSLTDLSGN